MMQDNRLLPLTPGSLDRPLTDLNQPKRYYGASASDSIHLRDYLAVVLKRKWLILSLVVVVTSLVTVQMYRQPPIYEAEATIQIQQKTGIIQTKDFVLNTGGDPTYWNTQLRLLENPELARQVVLALDLQNNPAFFEGQSSSGILDSLRRIFYGDKSTPAHADTRVPVIDSATNLQVDQLKPEQLEKLEPYEDTLRANLTVEPIEKTSLVTLRFRHGNPEIAMKVVNTFAQVFINNDAQHTNAGRISYNQDLANRIATLQSNIEQDNNKLLAFKKSHDLQISAAPGVNLVDKQLDTYSSQLIDAEAKRKQAEAAYNAAKNSADDPWSIPEIQSDQSVQKLREKISDLEEKKSALKRTYTDEWPGVQAIDDQITQVKSVLERKPIEIITSLKQRYTSALDVERKIRSDYEQKRSEATQQGIDTLDIDSLTRELESNKQLYQTLLQKQNEVKLSSSDNANNVSVATPARLPKGPVGPARSRNIVVAFLLSLGIGIGLAFLLDYLDDTLKSIEDVDRYIHLPALALIPALRNERSALKSKNPAPGNGNESTALALIDDARSPLAEAYRHLRTSLLLSSAGQPPKTILVTSSQPSEGKTTTAVNTAVMLAQTGAEVLIIDCDLRRPRVHAHFKMSNAKGLTNCLSGNTDTEDMMQAYDKLPNLKVMPSGPVPPNPAELIGSDQMRQLLNKLGERFTHIVIDSPPSISFTDASILSTMVDGVMLVVHGGKSSRAVVRRAKQQLLDIGAHLYGIVLNNVKLEGSNSYYYGYYSSYYESDDEDEEVAEGASASGARG